MRKVIGVQGVVILSVLFLARGTAAELKTYPLTERHPDVKESHYTGTILRFLDRWPPPTVQIPDSRPVLVRAIKTPGHRDIIGMVKHFKVPFPMAKVVELQERYEDYPRMWEDVEKVDVEWREGNRVMTKWVRDSPAFFLPKIRFRMLHTIDRSKPGRVVFRQQFVDGNSLNSNETLVVSEKLSENETRISVLYFMDADFGPLRMFAEGEIWRKSMEGTFKDDIAFLARLEHPDWDVDDIADETDRVLDLHPFKSAEYTDLLKNVQDP